MSFGHGGPGGSVAGAVVLLEWDEAEQHSKGVVLGLETVFDSVGRWTSPNDLGK
jgi:hypothetical protein